ncbi:MAG: SpoIIE family protein phosphatase [Spirochaetaceae bacterium]
MSKETILIVDDEKSVLKALSRVFYSWAKKQNVDLVTYSSPKEALAYIDGGTAEIGVLISDLMMPEMNGIELLKETASRLPIFSSLILTGSSDIEKVTEAIESGISSFMLKPWDDDKLLEKVEQALVAYRIQRDKNSYVKMIDEELRWAGELQKTLLKTEKPKTEKADFEITYQPLPNLHCGGDYYDIIHFGHEQFIVLTGDVAGHGVKAAFITSILKTIIYRNYIKGKIGSPFSPAEFLSWLNTQVCNELEKFPDMIVTFLVIFIDIPNRKLKYSNAGHLPFYMYNGITPGKWFIESGPGMGFKPGLKYIDSETPLHSDDSVVCITDGLTEHPLSEKAVSLEDLEKIIVENAGTGNFHENIIRDAKALLHTDQLYDDTTLVSFKIHSLD